MPCNFVDKNVTDLPAILSQLTRSTDGQTDGRTDIFFVTRPPCIQCSAVKIVLIKVAVQACWRVSIKMEIQTATSI